MAESSVKPTESLQQRTDVACGAFEEECRAGRRPRIEDFASLFSAEERSHVCRELIEVELWHRRRSGETPHCGEYLDRFPELRDHLLSLLPPDSGMTHRVLSSEHETAISHQPGQSSQLVPNATTPYSASPSEEVVLRLGSRLGDYEILRELGRGGMGVV